MFPKQRAYRIRKPECPMCNFYLKKAGKPYFVRCSDCGSKYVAHKFIGGIKFAEMEEIPPELCGSQRSYFWEKAV